jgi:hypothetical protein
MFIADDTEKWGKVMRDLARYAAMHDQCRDGDENRSISAMPRKRRRAIKMPYVAMGLVRTSVQGRLRFRDHSTAASKLRFT